MDVPSPIDFSDPVQAREWVAQTVAKRPWRPRFFEAFAAELNACFERPFSLAELGSGPGHLAKEIVQNCRVDSYTAIDFSPAMHDLARKHLGPDADRIRFVVQDFRQTDWVGHAGIVDAIVTMQAAHEVRHKSHLPSLLRSIRSAIKPDGLLLFCDHYAEVGSSKNAELHPSREEQVHFLADAGFVDIRLLLDEGGMALYRALNAR